MAVWSKFQKQTAGTGMLEKAVRYGAAWEGGVSLGKTLNSVPEAPGIHQYNETPRMVSLFLVN